MKLIYFSKLISKENNLKKLLVKDEFLDESNYNQMYEWLNQINNLINLQIQNTDYEIAFNATKKLEKRIKSAYTSHNSESLCLVIYACCKT